MILTENAITDLDRRKSVEHFFNKGVVSDITYSDNELNKLSIKGESIKEKLSVQRIMLAEKIIRLSSKLDSISSKIEEDPENSYFNEYKKYGHSQIYKDGNLDAGNSNMREFNKILYCIEESKNEVKYINTLIPLIDNNKKYSLNLKIASDLGL